MGTVKKVDVVNHPAHYAESVNGVECIEAIKAALGTEGFIDYLRGQVLKYTWRMDKKGTTLQDAEKALWYLGRLVGELKQAGAK